LQPAQFENGYFSFLSRKRHLNTASKRQGFAGFSGQTDAESYLLSRRRMLSFFIFSKQHLQENGTVLIRFSLLTCKLKISSCFMMTDFTHEIA
jgi:hypothetical protein